MRLVREQHPHTFNPEAVKALSVAFDDAWSYVQDKKAALADCEAARVSLAKCIIEVASAGDIDHKTLVRKALVRFSL